MCVDDPLRTLPPITVSGKNIDPRDKEYFREKIGIIKRKKKTKLNPERFKG